MAVKASEPVFCQIDGWSRQVDAYIGDENLKLKGGSPSPNIEAAIKVSFALGNARVAYNYSGAWRMLSEKVDDTVKRQLDELRSMVDTLKSSNTLSIQGLTRRSQEFVNSLQLFDWQSQVHDVVPKYVIVDKRDQFSVTINGKFHRPAHHGRCTLSVFNKRAERITTTLVTLSFTGTLPNQLIPDALNHNCRFVQGTLEVDSYNSKLSSYNVVPSIFTVWFGVYPLNIGDVTIVSNKVKTLVQPFKSARMVLDPKDFPPGHLVERKITIYPTSGWRLNTQNGHAPKVILNGQFNHSLNSDQYDEKSMTFSIKQASDRIFEGQIEYEETKDEIQDEEVLQPVSLRWGQEHSIQKVAGQKFRIIRFKSFDNQEFEINGPDETKPYLKVKSTCPCEKKDCVDSLKLFAEAPK